MTSVRERLAEERRQEIVEAAYRLFVRRSIAGTTMQDIAAEVGLTAGALYRYYGNKGALTEAVFAWCEQERFLAFEAAQGAGTPFDAIIEVGRAAWRDFDHPDARERMALWLEATLASYRGDGTPTINAEVSLRHAMDRMKYVIDLAQEAGEIDPDLDAGTVSLMLLAIHAGVQQTFVLNPDADVHGALEVAIRMLDGLRPRAAAPTRAPRGATNTATKAATTARAGRAR